jgi:hypothetical protein
MAWWSRSGGDSASGEVGVVNVPNWPTIACSFVAMFPLCVVFEWDRVCVHGEVVFSSPVFSNFATTMPLLASVPVGHASLSTAIVSTNGEDAMVLLMFLTGTVRVLFAALVGCCVHVRILIYFAVIIWFPGSEVVFWHQTRPRQLLQKTPRNLDGTRSTCPPRNPKNSRVNC